MIDSHCHLDHEPLFSDLKNVIKRSKEIGVKKLLTISTSIESFSRVKEIVNKDDIIFNQGSPWRDLTPPHNAVASSGFLGPGVGIC